MTKAFKLNWHRPVLEELQTGTFVDRWSDDGDVEQDCKVKVDDCGFFIYWKSEPREGDVLELIQVNDIRPGKIPSHPGVSSSLRPRHGENIAEKSISVCSGLDMVNINLTHFVFANKEEADLWRHSLCSLTNNVKMNNVCPMTNLEKHWKSLHMKTTADGQVSVRQIAKTFASGKSAEKVVYSTLADCDLPCGKNDSIDPKIFTFEKFYKIYQSLCPRTDIEDLFSQITSESEISVKDLIEFMNETQRDPRLNEILYPHYDAKRVMEIITKYEKDPSMVQRQVISKDGLTNYLMSDENAPVFLDRLDIYQDMEQPLQHYYINSSHNTYLTGRQFGGKSSVEMYRQVLLAGCRCVELDCWDGKDPDYEPIITHGRAMCSEISFKDVIWAIRECAFVTSDYPVILSFENHCSRNQQYKMAKYCDEAFGDLLLKEPLPDYPLQPGVQLPSPERLKKKILIKNKRLSTEVEKKELELFRKGELALDDAMIGEDSQAASNGATASSASPVAAAIAGGSSSGSGGANNNSENKVAPSSTPYQGSTLNVHPYLSSMVNYTTPMKFQGFDFSEEENCSYKMSSFAEATAFGYLRAYPIELVNYNKRQLSRIYPKGQRIDSSNFNPQIFWNCGCQLVSLNFQKPDLSMQLNQGRFEYNGNCGYLLKPDFMRRNDRTFDPFAETPVDGLIAAQCNVQVISGQFLSDKKVGTYVVIDMYGLPTDTIRNEKKTRICPSNGLNPVYEKEVFHFRKIVLPELAVLRFAVYDDNNELLGQRILPFEDLQAGYRHIALRTEGNFPMTLPMLFCKIELKVYIPEGLDDFMNALSDPKKWLEDQEKIRMEQLEKLGINEDDIGVDVIKSSHKDPGVKPPGPGQPPKAPEEKEEQKFDPITPDLVKSDKSFSKLTKKHQKELETMRKKQQKERSMVQKTQCTAIEKLVKSKGRNNDVVDDPVVKQIINDQTKQWSEMLERHRKENWQLTQAHLKEQEDKLKVLMQAQQELQMKELEYIFKNNAVVKQTINDQNKESSEMPERHWNEYWELMQAHLKEQEDKLKGLMQAQQKLQMKELESIFKIESTQIQEQQAATSVQTKEDAKRDPTLKSKADRDRYLKEKSANNIKKFTEERKSLAVKQDKRREKLKNQHQAQISDLDKYVQNSMEMYKNEEIEYQLSAKPECFV